MNLPQSVSICEVGPRDGLLFEKKIIATSQKVALINASIDAGVKSVEVGAFLSPQKAPQMADTDQVMLAVNRADGVEFRAFVPDLAGTRRAIACGITKIKLTGFASMSQSLNFYNKTPDEHVRGYAECVSLAADSSIPVSGAIGTAFGCPFEGAIPLDQVKDMVRKYLALGITEISLSDTTGMANPLQVYRSCVAMRREFPEVTWVLHFHNTRAMGMANILGGMQAGVRVFDGSFAGLGGCPFAPGASGNVATEDIVNMCCDMDIATGIDLARALDVARMAEKCVGHAVDSAVLKAGRTTDLHTFTPRAA